MNAHSSGCSFACRQRERSSAKTQRLAFSSFKEELLDIVPLKDRTRGIDIKETLMAVVEKADLQLSKLTAISTDGAPAMLGSGKGLVGLCKADDRFPEFWTFHCIIHQEHLVSKKLNFDHIMKPVLEIVNFIRTHALNHRQFKNLIAELDEDLPSDLLLHCARKDYPELQDPLWISDLAFLVDMLHYLNGLNVDLQGKSKMVSDLASGQAAEVVNGSTARYATLLENLEQSFEDRFSGLRQKRPQISFLINPFTAESDCLKAPLVEDEAATQLEMIELSEDDRLKSVLREGTVEFWKIQKQSNLNVGLEALLPPEFSPSFKSFATSPFSPPRRHLTDAWGSIWTCFNI
ncbi:protein FAM200B [Pimephales promelas]|nr:protein FAM200B [Pimephales promelas]